MLPVTYAMLKQGLACLGEHTNGISICAGDGKRAMETQRTDTSRSSEVRLHVEENDAASKDIILPSCRRGTMR